MSPDDELLGQFGLWIPGQSAAGGKSRGKTRLYLFSEWLPSSREALEARMAQWAPRVLDNGFDGIDVHEAANFEGAGCMEVLGRFATRLEGHEPEPLE